MSRGVPDNSLMTARTSSRLRTMGRRFGRLARTTSSSQGRFERLNLDIVKAIILERLDDFRALGRVALELVRRKS